MLKTKEKKHILCNILRLGRTSSCQNFHNQDMIIKLIEKLVIYWNEKSGTSRNTGSLQYP